MENINKKRRMKRFFLLLLLLICYFVRQFNIIKESSKNQQIVVPHYGSKCGTA